MENPTHFTGYLIDPEFQEPAPEDVSMLTQEVAESLPAFQEFQREQRLDEV